MYENTKLIQKSHICASLLFPSPEFRQIKISHKIIALIHVINRFMSCNRLNLLPYKLLINLLSGDGMSDNTKFSV